MKILVICQYYKPEPFRISDICAPAGSAEALAEAVREFASMTVDQRREMAQNSASYYAAHFRREAFMD